MIEHEHGKWKEAWGRNDRKSERNNEGRNGRSRIRKLGG